MKDLSGETMKHWKDESSFDRGAAWFHFLKEKGYPPATICPVTNRAVFKKPLELADVIRLAKEFNERYPQ